MHLIRSIIGSVHSFPLTFGGVKPTDVFLGSPRSLSSSVRLQHVAAAICRGPQRDPGRQDVRRGFLEAIPRYKVTMFNAVPTAFNQILNHPNIADYDLSSLRVVMSGSAPLLASTFQRFKELTGLEIVNGIGSTESIGTQLASYLPGYKPGATGWPVPGVQAKIIDDDGNECAPGVTGRLVVKACYGTMYWRDVERQKKAVIDGWSLSGDYATRTRMVFSGTSPASTTSSRAVAIGCRPGRWRTPFTSTEQFTNPRSSAYPTRAGSAGEGFRDTEGRFRRVTGAGRGAQSVRQESGWHLICPPAISSSSNPCPGRRPEGAPPRTPRTRGTAGRGRASEVHAQGRT